VSVSKFISTPPNFAIIFSSFVTIKFIQFRAHAKRNFIFARDLEREQFETGDCYALALYYQQTRARSESVINTAVLTAFCTIGNIPCEAQVEQAESKRRAHAVGMLFA
jgi:hypothetical protein